MNDVKVIANFHNSYLSIARFFGGVTINGKHFVVVCPKNGEKSKLQNALIREDLVKQFGKLRKEDDKNFDEILRELAK